MSVDYTKYPTDVRERIRAVVDEVLAAETDRVRVAEVLTERVFAIADEAILQATVFMIGQQLAAMPEEQRKARMFDMLKSMGLLDQLRS